MPSGNSSNNNNSGINSRGAIPKKKKTREVPQNSVPPTQRQLNVLVDWASLQDHQHQQQQHSQPPATSVQSKSRNNRSGGEGIGFEIDNLSLQEHNNKFIPVRPILRKNFANEDQYDTSNNSAHTSNTAIVIPTTPNSSALQQSNASSLLNENYSSIPILTHMPTTRHMDSSAGNSNPFRSNSSNNHHTQHHLLTRPNIEDKLNQIQEYIRITTSLINSVQHEDCNPGDYQNLLDNLTSLRDSERKLIALLPIEEEMEMANNEASMRLNINGFEPINSNSLSDVSDADESNGPRPHSVQSINTVTDNTPSQTPTYEDVKFKLDSSTRNIQTLKDQQTHILRLQQAAKQQLQEMEHIRQNYGTVNTSMESSEEVHENVANLLNRISAISTFIQNQNEMANSLSENHGVDVASEQALLQSKLQELKNKKHHMESLVNELQMNVTDSEMTPMRIVPVEVERIVPIELTHQPKDKSHGTSVQSMPVPMSQHQRSSAPPPSSQAIPVQHHHHHIDEHPETEDEMTDGPNAAVMQETATMLTEKISEINKMKDQLQRLKDMMDTVKLIEAKTGPDDDEHDGAEEDESPENSRSASVVSQLSGDAAVRPESEPERERASGGQKPSISNRVDALEAMTQDLRQQAASIAEERDRLRAVQNEIKNRREKVQSALEKNLQQISTSSNSSSQGLNAGVLPKERQQTLLESQKKELEKIEKMAENIKKAPEANNWRNTNTVALETVVKTKPPLATVSATHLQQQQQQQQQSATNTGSKNSATDSGATDLFMTYETGSFPSDSTRSLNMIPPMPDLCARTAKWRNNFSDGSATHQASQSNENAATNTGGGSGAQRDHVSGGGTSPWLIYNGPSSAGGGPQSPNFHTPFSGSENLHHFNPYSLPHYANLPMPGASSATTDPLVFQHLIQTQQMLMNSITQCNQLLWIQQKEINNLNNAVLLLQERVLNAVASNTILSAGDPISCNNTMRAESTPPMNNGQQQQQQQPAQLFSRARSEQPVNVTIPTQSPFTQNFSNVLPNFQQQPSSSSYSGGTFNTGHPYSISQQIQRNNTNFNNRNFRNSTQRAVNNNTIYEQQSNCYQQQPTPSDLTHSNNFMSLNNPLQEHHHSVNSIQNNIGSSNSNLNNSNLQYHQNLSSPQNNNLYMQRAASGSVAAATPPPQSRTSMQAQSTPALNNQVMPGNRANNYWDNFRSYSRQNLLSTNSCKSNEDACSYTTHTNNPNNIERNSNNHNSLRNLNKFQCYHRNYNSSNSNINQANAAINQPEVFNQLDNDSFHINQQNPQPQHQQQIHQQQQTAMHQQHQLQQSNSLELGDALQFHTNPINLGVNEFSSKSKTLPKGGNNKKYAFPVRYRDCNSLNDDDDEATGGDLNLARSSNYNDSKSTSKLFEALKENVYQEVKNLITANESRPHFLIQLFRELQCISSDPLRQRTLQSIQELYSRYVESAIIHEENNSNSLVASSTTHLIQNEIPNRPINNNFEQQSQLNRSTDMGYDFPTSQSTPRNLHQNLLQISITERELVNLIMTEIIDAIHAVDYINDSLLQKITNIVFTYSTDSSDLEAAANIGTANDNFSNISNKLNNKLVINNEDFLHHLHKWSRTDKDEFISNLENYLNNLMVGFSAAGSGTGNGGDSGDVDEEMNSTVFSIDLAPVCSMVQIPPAAVVVGNVLPPENVVVVLPARQTFEYPLVAHPQPQLPPQVHQVIPGGSGNSNRTKHYSELSVSSSSSFIVDNPCNGDLAEADQICDVDNENSEDDRNMETNDEACCMQPFILEDFDELQPSIEQQPQQQPQQQQQQQQQQQHHQPEQQMWVSNVEMDRKNNPKNTSM